jgi:large subunit ribosomal protein L20
VPRVKRGNKRRLKRKKVLKRAKGYFLSKSKNYRIAKQQVEHSLAYSYRDRRARKRQFRRLWIVRIAAACKELEYSYGRFIRGLKVAGVALDRKSLADIAVRDPAAFRSLCEVARKAVPAPEGPAAAA